MYLKYRVRTTPVARYLVSEALFDLNQLLKYTTMTITCWLPQQYTCKQVKVNIMCINIMMRLECIKYMHLT